MSFPEPGALHFLDYKGKEFSHVIDPEAWQWPSKERKELLRFDGYLRRITYKPRTVFSWNCELNSVGTPEKLLLNVRMTVADADNPSRETKINTSGMMDFRTFKMMEFPEFYRWVWQLCRNLEVHELNEFFKVDGKAPFDPHREENRWKKK